MKYLPVLMFLSLMAVSCRKDFEGEVNQPGPPETYMVVDSVQRDSSNFLVTTVRAHWWGVAPKGLIKGYEVSSDGMQNWQYTTLQSGTFLLNLPVGVKRGEIPVYVRAIDHLGNIDPTPASMVFPVENSAPRVVWSAGLPTPDKSFPVIKIFWNASDIDGLADIDHYEMVWNDTAQMTFAVPGNTQDIVLNDTSGLVSVRIEARKNGTDFLNSCLVYTGNKISALPGEMSGLKHNSFNTIYIRAIDKTGNASAWISDSLMVRIPASGILLVNALYANGALLQSYYLTRLSAPGLGFDSIEVLRGVNTINGNSELYTDALTQKRTFALFNHLIWLTDDANTLTTAQLTTQDFFGAGGTMYIYAQFGDEFPVNAQVLSFTPAQALVDPASKAGVVNGRFRMDNTCSTLPLYAGWPVLQYSGSISAARPFLTNPTSSGLYRNDSLMNAVIRVQTATGSPLWDGPSTMVSRRVRIATGKADMILNTLPLHNLNGNNNVDSFFRKVFVEELSF